MEGLFKKARQDKIISWGSTGTGVIILITLFYIFIRLSSLPPYIPVYNQLPWGNERISQTYAIFIPVAVATIFGITNFIISSFVYPKSQVISRLLIIAGLLISLLSFLFILRTIQLVT